MKQFLTFIGGFVAGIFATLFVVTIIGLGIRSNYKGNEVQVQFIEVKGKKGNVTIYTGMLKDSVQILVGKPDKIDIYSIGDTHYEKWGYKLKNGYMSDLDIDFKNGKLEGLRQN